MRYREVEKLLKEDGWYEVGKKGSHHHFKHPVKPGKNSGSRTRGQGYKPQSCQGNLEGSRSVTQVKGEAHCEIGIHGCIYAI